MNIPLEFFNEAQYSAETSGSEQIAEFFLMKPNGKQFGEKISIKFKVFEKIEEPEFFQRAMDIFESLNDQEDGLFDLVVECLKEAGSNIKGAKELLEAKRKPKAQEENLYD
jgi:hypothetical protein